jgi:pyruvate kinase
MRQIIETAEADFPYRDFFLRESRIDCHDISCAISLASVRTAYSLDAKAIFAFTSSGFTARLISRYRPEMPILALTEYPKTYHQLAFNWGVIPVDPTHSKTRTKAYREKLTTTKPK